MQNDTAGYVADIPYTYGYFAELNPVHARFALLAAGFAPPRVETACELGFGQGVSINVHAAASKTRWWGNDFLPQQAAFAQGLAEAAGSSATLTAESFADFCHRKDMPDMDFIALHGVWTWVNEESRNTIVDFIRRKLKPGGVVYASYNTQPGWANMVPLRELFVEYADAMVGPQQSTADRINTAMSFTQKLLAANPRFLQGNALATQQVRAMLAQEVQYLAHEYFNRDWQPMSFTRFSKRMEPAGLTFACPGNMLEHVDALFMSPDQMALVQGAPDARVRQSVRDFVLNANFRRDYWVRDAKRLEGDAHRRALEEQQVVLCRRPENVSLRVGEARLSEAIYLPIIEELAHYKSRSIGDLASALGKRNVTFDQLMQALVVLAGRQDVQAAQPAGEASPATADRFNRHVMRMATKNRDVQYLANPVTGGALMVPRFDQLFLLAVGEGEKSIEGWAKSAWQHLAAQNERLVHDGYAVVGEVESIELMKGHAREFAGRLEGYRALGMAG